MANLEMKTPNVKNIYFRDEDLLILNKIKDIYGLTFADIVRTGIKLLDKTLENADGDRLVVHPSQQEHITKSSRKLRLKKSEEMIPGAIVI